MDLRSFVRDYIRCDSYHLNYKTRLHVFEPASASASAPDSDTLALSSNMAWDLRSIPLLGTLANAAVMDVFGIWLPILLALIAPASLAYPSNRSSQSLTLAFPTVNSQANLTNLRHVYPVYPTVCIPPPRGQFTRPSDLPEILSDCSRIINEDLLRKDSLLFQNLVFNRSSFRSQSGRRYPSRWESGLCVIQVSCGNKLELQILQLLNVVLAANKILKECIEDQRISQGGIVPIGPPSGSFYVSVLGLRGKDAISDSNLLSIV